MQWILSLFMFLSVFTSVYAGENATAYQMDAKDRVAMEKIEHYLSGIHTIASDFIQAAPGGGISTGSFYLERPGKLRMEYAPPVPVLMVTSGGDIVYYDRELDQISRISLDSTLVGFLAREKVRFDNSVIITGFERGDNSVRISLVQSDKPKDGTLTLEFSDNPLIIRNMVITDNSGQKTTVSLNNARFNLTLDAALFVFKDPHLGKRNSIKN